MWSLWNTASKDEIEVIAKLYSYFLAQKYIDEGVERDITADDILVVAPYNVQVNLIQKNYLREIEQEQ